MTYRLKILHGEREAAAESQARQIAYLMAHSFDCIQVNQTSAMLGLGRFWNEVGFQK